MIVYTYKCPKCETTVERFRNSGDRDDLVVCVHCNTDMRRTWNVGGIVIK